MSERAADDPIRGCHGGLSASIVHVTETLIIVNIFPRGASLLPSMSAGSHTVGEIRQEVIDDSGRHPPNALSLTASGWGA